MKEEMASQRGDADTGEVVTAPLSLQINDHCHVTAQPTRLLV